MLVTSATFQPGIAPYSLVEHIPSTGFVPKHVTMAAWKFSSVMVIFAGGGEGGEGGGEGGSSAYVSSTPTESWVRGANITLVPTTAAPEYLEEADMPHTEEPSDWPMMAMVLKTLVAVSSMPTWSRV